MLTGTVRCPWVRRVLGELSLDQAKDVYAIRSTLVLSLPPLTKGR